MQIHPKYTSTLNRLQRLNPSAEVLAKVSRMIRDPHNQIEDIALVLRTDSSLTSDIIRMSNSAYYGQNSNVTSLDEALKRIGLKEAQRLVNLSLARSLYSKKLKYYLQSAYSFWASGVACAAIMELLAPRFNHSTQEAHTLGTLHALGKNVIDTLLTETNSNQFWDKKIPITDWEAEMIGKNHAEAGADLLARWKFPENIVNAVGNHIFPDEQSSLETHALHLATVILAQVGYEFKGELKTFPEPSATLLNIESSQIPILISESRNHFFEAVESLGINPSNDKS